MGRGTDMAMKVILRDSLNLPLMIGNSFGSVKQIVFPKITLFRQESGIFPIL